MSLGNPRADQQGETQYHISELRTSLGRSNTNWKVCSIEGSVGSACTTGSTEVSHVLSAMGYPEEEARGALRLSLGRTTTEAEIETAAEVVPRVVASMRMGSVAVAADPLGQGVGV